MVFDPDPTFAEKKLDSDPTNSRKKTLISPNNIQLCLDSLIKSRIIKVKMICMAKEVDLN